MIPQPDTAAARGPEAWVRSYYDDIDAMRMDEYLSWHVPDVRIQFAKSPPAVGTEHLRDAIGHFWTLIGGLSHDLVNVWTVDDGWVIVESRVTYHRKDRRLVIVPCMTTLHRLDEKIDEVRIFMDGSSILAN